MIQECERILQSSFAHASSFANCVKPLRIAGVGYSVPQTVLTNDDLTKLYETSDEWIYTRTGIKERRVVSGNQDAVDLGYEASQMAIENRDSNWKKLTA